jgi:Arc/MetJ-type ribon-helix-helix transcriptional regulator
MLGASSESEAVREAIDRALAGEEIIAAFHRLRKRGTWTNRYRHTTS